MLLLPDHSLATLNTLAVPAQARAYVPATRTEQVVAALTLAQEKRWPLLPLGGGSNIVLTGDFAGMVLHLQSKGIEKVDEDSRHVYVRVAAGENWHQLVEYSLQQHWWGLENLALIPGNVGAAPIQNIGAYGVELEEVFEELQALEVNSGLAVTFSREACEFRYRDSVFKGRLRDRYIITHVILRLNKQPELRLEYPALHAACAHLSQRELTPQKVSELVADIRRTKLPDPAQIPNAGSFFKNPVVSVQQFNELQQAFPGLVAYPQPRGVKLAAGWLIEQAGWRGFTEQGVAVHDRQALVLTNPGRSSGKVILALAERIVQSVVDLFGVVLETEPRIY